MRSYSRRHTAAAVLLSLPMLAEAAEKTYPIHIDSQPLSAALTKFCEQTGLLPWYASPSPLAGKIIVNAVEGDHTPSEALRMMAGDTGVSFEIVGDRYVNPKIPANWKLAGTHLASVDLMEANVPIPEVLVKGSKSSNVTILAGETGPSALTVFRREQLERSGYRKVGEFLRGMLTSNVVTTLPSGAAMISNVSRPIDLFGLSASDTTVTIDGHLLAGLAMGGLAQQVDLDSIDLYGVERIEVMQGTATALGGNGGTAGRVNIVSRVPLAGTLVNVRSSQYPHSDASSRDLSIASGFGRREERGSLSLKASWSSEDAIWAGQHNTISAGSERVASNNPERIATTFPPLSSTPNMRTLSGVPVSAYSYDLAPTAQEMGGAYATFRPSHDMKSFELGVARDFQSGISFDAAAGGWRSIRSGLVSVIEEKIPRTQMLPPNSPGNPLGVPVLQTAASALGDGPMTSQQDSRFARVALRSSLFGAGMIRLEQFYSSAAARMRRPALTASNGGLTLDTAETRPYESSAEETTLQVMTPVFGRAHGTGYLTVSAGYRQDDLADASAIGTAAEADAPSSSIPHGSQIMSYLQGQLAMPLLAPRDGRANPLLQTELSVRRDQYHIATDQMAKLGREPDMFHKVTGHLALSFQPFDAWAFRAGASTGFRPAPLTLLSPAVEQQFASLPVPDPLRGGELLRNVTVIYGGSFNLRPETARTFKAGLVFAPALDDDFKLTADYVWIRKKDVILGPDDLFFGEPGSYFSRFPWRVSRESTTDGSPGAVYRIDTTALNIAQLDVKALDLGLNWRTRAGPLGTFEVVTNATVAPSFERKLTPDSTAANEAGIGTQSAPRYRLNVQGVLTGGPLELGITGKLISKTRISLDGGVIEDQGGRTVGRQGYLDLFVAYSMNLQSLGNAKLRVRFDANNVLRRAGEFNALAPRYVDRFGEDELPSLALSFSVQTGS